MHLGLLPGESFNKRNWSTSAKKFAGDPNPWTADSRRKMSEERKPV
jgi:hypothetical protein